MGVFQRPVRELKIGDKSRINVLEFTMLHIGPVDPFEGWAFFLDEKDGET